MKDLKLYGRMIIGFSLLLWPLFQFSKNTFRWPAFIADNIFFICLGLTLIGYVLLYIYYTGTKNPRKAKELVIIAAVIAACFGLVYLISK